MPSDLAPKQRAEQEAIRQNAQEAEVVPEGQAYDTYDESFTGGAGGPGGGAAGGPGLPGENHDVELAVMRAPNATLRQTVFRRYQARHGNFKATALVYRLTSRGTIQRHPAGAVSAPGKVGPAAAEVSGGGTPIPFKPDPNAPSNNANNAAPGNAAPGSAPGPAPSGGSAPAPAPAAPAPASAPGQAPGQQPAGQAPGSGGTQFGTSGNTTTTGSGSVSGSTMQATTAQKILQDKFGKVAGQPITGGKITIVDGKAALYALIDQFSIQDGDKTPDGKPWENGFAEKYIEGRVLGFARKDGSIYIDKTGTDPTIMVHEMLHVNASKAWQAAMPTSVDEGVTEDLAIQAVTSAGFSASGSESTYPKEREVVGLMAGVVGMGTVTAAYFNGPTSMQAAYEAVMGAGTFAAFIKAMSSGNLDKAKKLLRKAPNYVDKVNDLLDGWVSDADVEEIIRLYGLVADDEKAKIRAAVSARVTELNNMGQRARLRGALGI